MFAQTTISFDTNDLNSILKQLDWDVLRRDSRLEFKEKSTAQINQEETKIFYELCENAGGPVINATILTNEYYDDVEQPIEVEVKLSKEEILQVITEYFAWQDVPYTALSLEKCTETKEKTSVKGKEDFGTITIKLSKIKYKTRERNNSTPNLLNQK